MPANSGVGNLKGGKPTGQLAAKDEEILKLDAAIDSFITEWIPRHYLTDRERTIKKLTKQAAEQAAEDASVLRESFPGLACVRVTGCSSSSWTQAWLTSSSPRFPGRRSESKHPRH